MKKIIFSPIGYAVLLMSLTAICFSCNKNDVAAKSTSCTITWTTGGSSFTTGEVDAYLFSNTLIALKDTSSVTESKNLQITLLGTPGPGYNVGTYDLTIGGNSLNYFIGKNASMITRYAISGTVTITSKSSNKINGSFSATFNNLGGTISGTFSNVEIS